jgi:hypothetical protein
MPVTRSKDKKGSYYVWGQHGKRYYYTAGDSASRTLAKSKAERQGRAAHANGYEGAGLGDALRTGYDRVRNALKGPREGIPPKLKSFLDKDGGQKIESVTIARRPLAGGITTLLDVLSRGGFSKVKRRLGYDQVYHNYLVVKTKDGGLYKLEKNHVVEEAPATANDLKNEHYTIPVHKDLSVKDLIDNASSRGKSFWQYRPDSDTCQRFAKDVLVDSGLTAGVTDPRAREIIEPQDAGALLDSLGRLKGLPQKVTDIAGSFDRILHGGRLGSRRLKVSGLFKAVNGG